jgi:uncharacterized protein
MTGFRGKFSTFLRALPIALLVFAAPAVRAERAADLAKPTDYVSDYAHVLSAETVARLDRVCTQLDHSAANAQIAVVTVNSLDGADSADWANELEAKWKIGKKGSDRGVLILLAVGDHKRRIDVGYGLEGILPDAKVGDIGREMVPYLRANDFDSAVMMAVSQVGQVIATDAKVTLDDGAGQMPAQASMERPVHHGFPLGKLILLIILLIFFGGGSLMRMLLGFGLFNMFMGGGGGFRGGGGFGGGGDGGGSGFGGFGGGDFGGGGAGGDW